ncbi:unnamed protein product [Rotaria socialis]|uniref:Uncharacterized protein n=1 Tax=Rotaria socialis TaxID=392032 RepID=A0A818MXQ6_9BILA|nr:unnamed protein product [Rotaria socialis]CAF3433283.1 unnamed protein product [Rotaria socialis]CAF3435349.1 unnamed protein product [Rotaria socialis]CAF3561757.1 unnamed protein product [Rotaria socialis]CAF3597180.1 unnamed protein product [Rotaria socialis]
MYSLRQQQIKQLIYLFCIFIAPTLCISTKEILQTIRCNVLHQNCTFPPSNSSSDSISSIVSVRISTSQTTRQSPIALTTPQRPTIRTNRQSLTSRLTLPTTRLSSTTTKQNRTSSFDAFSDNLKRAALILAGIAIGLGILRICLMLCKSRSPSNSSSNRHTATVRPQVATIEHHQFKPDLPPAYAEAIRGRDNEGGKLPSYEELSYEQRQEPQINNNIEFISTQV